MTRWKKLGYKLGLTKRTKYELSDIICEDAVVVSKKEELFFPIHTTRINYEKKYWITFKGENVTLTRNRRDLYTILKKGDEVELCYKERHGLVYNYVPPNFEEKKLIRKRLSHHNLVSAKKKNQIS